MAPGLGDKEAEKLIHAAIETAKLSNFVNEDVTLATAHGYLVLLRASENSLFGEGGIDFPTFLRTAATNSHSCKHECQHSAEEIARINMFNVYSSIMSTAKERVLSIADEQRFIALFKEMHLFDQSYKGKQKEVLDSWGY